MWQRVIVQMVVGAVLGYAWHRLSLPLTGGGCPLTCSPWRARLLGASVGLLWPAKAPGAADRGLDVTGFGTKEGEMTTDTLTTGAPVHISEATFASLVQTAKTPILLDAYADWCGPCRRLAPELERVARDLSGRLVVAKLNV
ncbi:MAG: hypothetical protein HYU66_17765, partial [Armatimonadetes bacterium]|nr:hypothetical protein [Armatimonadota bacterium]